MRSVFRSKRVILPLTCLALVLVTFVVLITLASNDPYRDIFMISRDVWQGLDPLEPLPVNDAALLVVIKHTGGAGCADFKTCSARVREIQKKDMEQYPDIRYNFLIGGDDRIYEGRGWLVQNEGIRNESVDIAFIGDFNTGVPSTLMLRRALYLVLTGHKINYNSYRVVAHNHTEPTDSPGKNVYKHLNKDLFSHYSTKICYSRVDGKVVPTDTCPPIQKPVEDTNIALKNVY